MRVVAVAQKTNPSLEGVFSIKDESDMVLMGYIAFLDPPKETSADTIKVKRKIELMRRWDGFKIPLLDYEIIINFHNLVEVTRKDRKEKFSSLRETIKVIIENGIVVEL